MKRYWLLLVLPLLLLAWWVWGRGESTPVIHFDSVGRANIESAVTTNGKVEPAEWAAARAQTAGVVQNVAVQLGRQVQAGQVLVGLDATAAQSAVTEALARQQEARAEVNTLGQGGKAVTLAGVNDSISSAQAAVEVAQRNYDAMQRMASAHAATKLQTLEAKDLLDRAELQLQAAENQRKSLVTQGDRAVAVAKLADAEAAVHLARHRAALSTVQAPISGTLYQFDMKVGTYLEAGGLVGLVGNLDQVKVLVYVDEPDLGRVALGMPVKIGWDARPGQTWWGHVNQVPAAVTSLGTRTVGEVTTIVDNPHHDLIPGVTVNAVIVSKVVKDAASIPKAALRNLRAVSGVYKLSGDTLAWTPVITGVSDVNNVQIVSGLQIGDRVADRVVEPADAEFKDGQKVKAVIGQGK